MKFKSYCMYATMRWIVFLAWAMISLPGFAQHEDDKRVRADSARLHLQQQQAVSLSGVSPVEEFSDEVQPLPPPSDSLIRIPLLKPLVLPYYTDPSPMFQGDFSTGGIIRHFPHGAFYGRGAQTTLPGMGVINEATLGYMHQLNDALQLQVDVSAVKMNQPFAVGQTFGTSGALFYQASDRLAFRVFGGYAMGRAYGLKSSHYGATMRIDMSERFSLEMGVQRYYNQMTGRWETVPVAIPSYKFNKMTLGLDVGGLLYQWFHRVVVDPKGMRMGNPTIGPPR